MTMVTDWPFPIIKRSVVVRGHKTSISLEEPFWIEFHNIAHERNVTLTRLLSEVEETRSAGNLSSAIRMFVLANVKAALARASSGRMM